MHELLLFDYELFYLINTVSSNAVFDAVMPFLREEYFWSPLYLFLISFLLFNYPRRQAWLLILFAVLTIVISDQLASSFIKPYFDRLRPCRDENFMQFVRLLVPCGSGRSFVSSHATNHFAAAIYFSLFFQKNWVTTLLVLWATVVCYGQVYVGLHFPSDVVAGALLGGTIGWVMSKVAARYEV